MHRLTLLINLYDVLSKMDLKGADALKCMSVDSNSMQQLLNTNIFPVIEFIEIVKHNSDLNVAHHFELVNPIHPLLSHNVGDGDGYVGREVLIPFYNITYNKVQNSRTSVCAVEYQDVGGISNADLLTQQSLNGQPKKAITHIVGTNQSPMMEAQLELKMLFGL